MPVYQLHGVSALVKPVLLSLSHRHVLMVKAVRVPVIAALMAYMPPRPGTGRGLAASQGPGLMLSYKLNEDWSLGLAGRYEDIEFRLDNEGPAAGGVGRDQSMPVVFMATLEPSKKFSLSVFTGIELNGTLKLKDALGDVVEESSYDPAALFGATFEIRF